MPIWKYENVKVLATLVVCIFAYLHTCTIAYCDEGPGRDYFADAAFRQEYRDAAIAIAKRKIAHDWYNGNAEYFVRMKTVVEDMVPEYELIGKKRHRFNVDFCGWGALAPIAIPAEFK